LLFQASGDFISRELGDKKAFFIPTLAVLASLLACYNFDSCPDGEGDAIPKRIDANDRADMNTRMTEYFDQQVRGTIQNLCVLFKFRTGIYGAV